MIVNLDWQTFQQQFLQQVVFVKENETDWEFWTSSDKFIVRSNVEKMEDDIENIMFVDRFLNEHKNIIKVIDVKPEEVSMPIEVPMISNEAEVEDD